MNSNLLSDEVPDFEQELTKEQLSQKIVRDNRDVVEIVGGLLVQTDALQHQHSLMFSQFSKLSGKTIELTQSTHNAILEVNNSFIELKAVLDREQHSRSRYFWESCAMWVLERLLQFDASSAEELLRLPMLGGLVTFVGALSSVLRIVISITMIISITTHGPMALSPPQNLPPRFAALHRPSAAHTQAQEPQSTPSSSPKSCPPFLQPSLNHSNGSSTRSGFTRVEVLEEGTLRFFYADNSTTTFKSTPSGSTLPSRNPAPRFTQRRPRSPFNPFGIPAERTAAQRHEICSAFIDPATRCRHGHRCFRIHPLDKETYRQKLRNALALDNANPNLQSSGRVEEKDTGTGGSKATPDPPLLGDATPNHQSSSGHTEGKDTGVKGCEATPDLPKSLLLADASKPTLPESPDNTTAELSSLNIGPAGWSENGSWMGSSKADSWTTSSTSPTTSNDLLPSTSSCSSSPTTVSPDLSEDDKEEDKDDEPGPTPAPPRNLATTICVMFKKSGKCPRGSNCIFRHVQEAIVPSSPSPPQPDTKKTATPVTAPPESRTSSSSTPAIKPSTSSAAPKANKTSMLSVASSPAKASPAPSTVSSITTPTVPAVAVSSRPPVPPMSTAPVQSSVPVAPVRPPERSFPPQFRVRHPRPQSNEVCRKWLQNLCSYGYACKWVHGDLEYDAPEPVKPPSTSTSTDDFLLSMTLHDHMRVQCSAGLDIQRIQTAFESSTLLVSNISPRVRPGPLREILSSYGTVEDIWLPSTFSSNTVVKVTYSDTAEAQKAQNALNGTKMYDLTITAKVANSGNITAARNALLKDTAIRITWEAPAKEVYAGYATGEDAERAIQIARDSPLNGHYLRGEIYEGMPAVDVVNVHFRGVPLDVDKPDLVRFVNPVDIMWTRPNYKEPEGAIRFIKNRLRDWEPESVEILPPPYRDGGLVKAWAVFPTSSKAREAARFLDNRKPKCTGFTPIRAVHVQSLSYSLTQERWSKIGTGIEGTAVGIPRETCFCHHHKTLEGADFLRDLSTKNPNVYYENDVQHSCIRVHGYVADRVRLASAIIAKVKAIRSQQTLDIPLPGRLLGATLGNQSLRMMRLKHGYDNAYFDVPRRVLRIRGDFSFYQKFKVLVDQIEQRIPKSSSAGPTCPICFDKPSLPISLQCGHTWCRPCISQYFQSAKEQKTFPLKCLGQDGRCGLKIPIAVAKQVLSGSELEATVTAAFLAHVSARPKEYHFCPTPDCPQVYRTTQQKATLQCPSCLTSICTRCHTEAHDEFQCSDQVQDELFKKWIKEHDVKHCPTCDAPIEKVEGCNHMMCTQCQTHICWQCTKTFPGGEGIYGHMREVHGTFGLGQTFD
ncbi:hypothetical protein NP233_g12526 [Leucocoprinus birnbaumii]|uniref:Uncharacterized protein n=1 Tax=Leucocoprinus birnbaumii TaxID=56174 RepID=A0AAD5VJW9_9AGAR|nr:hypothetical protein NP233_g12526 [Leucocoprinus birnbaumii]